MLAAGAFVLVLAGASESWYYLLSLVGLPTFVIESCIYKEVIIERN